MGKSRFEETTGIDRFRHVLRLLPPDLPNWERNDGREARAPFTVFADGKPNRYSPEVESAHDGCVRNTGSREDDQFVCIPIGILDQGLELQARESLQFTAYDPQTGKAVHSATLRSGDRIMLPSGHGALVILGKVLAIQTGRETER
jgi:hypothetical protein